MAPQPTSAATVVIFTALVLNTLTAPETRRPMENSTGRCVHDPGCLAGRHLPSLPPVASCGGSGGGVVNITGSPPLLMVLFSFPGEGNQSVCRPWNYSDVNRRIHRPSPPPPLEPGIYYGGAPRVQELVSSDPFGFSLSSLDSALSSFYASSVMFVFPNIQKPHTYKRRLRKRFRFTEFFFEERFAEPVHFAGSAKPASDSTVFFSYKKSAKSVRFQRNEQAERGAFPRLRLKNMASHKTLPPPVTFAGGHRKLLGSQGSSTMIRRHRKEPRERVVSRAAAAAAALALFGLLCTITGLVLWCMRNKLEADDKLIHQIELGPSAPRRYRRRELAAATHGFAEAEKIGRGGFGAVYRGFLADQERHVAIKVLSSSSVQAQGMREFQAEVKVMTRLRHRNIVQLLGWSGDREGRLMLVYELVPNGSLDKHLHDPQRQVLPWKDRYKIALGVGSAILYLHTECEQCVLHGDIKPANILLDASCNAKLGDFGLARLVDHGTDPRTTQVVAGTPGYMDPEFVNNGRPSAEADVFSFGVVLLELACGRRPTAAQSNAASVLVSWVRDMYHKNTVLGAADRRLDGEFDGQEMRRVLVAGLWCTHHDQSQRPPIAQAMDLLRRQDAELPILPEMHTSATASVRSLEEIAYGDLDLSAEDSVFQDSSADTAYHTSEVSTCIGSGK